MRPFTLSMTAVLAAVLLHDAPAAASDSGKYVGCAQASAITLTAPAAFRLFLEPTALGPLGHACT